MPAPCRGHPRLSSLRATSKTWLEHSRAKARRPSDGYARHDNEAVPPSPGGTLQGRVKKLRGVAANQSQSSPRKAGTHTPQPLGVFLDDHIGGEAGKAGRRLRLIQPFYLLH